MKVIDPRLFLSRVLPWPGASPGYVNVHVMGKKVETGQDGKQVTKTFWSGTPTKNVDEFVSAVMSYMGWATTPDVYMCMSQQAKTRTINGNIRAAKSQAEALEMKCLYADLDVKEGQYTKPTEAIAAVYTMADAEKIPRPTAVVFSGGGVHTYWISKVNLPVEKWQQYADGLKGCLEHHKVKCDLMVTNDSARVLRVPGTFNMKKEPRRPVSCVILADHDLDFDTQLQPLLKYAGAPKHTAHTFQALPTIPGKMDWGRDTEGEAGLLAGIQPDTIDPLPIFGPQGCPMYREAFATGGKDVPQGVWMLSILGATFMENGNAIAHRISRGYAGYDPVETENMWQRKLAERTTQHLGWPSCRSIKDQGCKACAGCPHLAAGKSPLNIRGSSPVGGVGPAPSGVAPAVAYNPQGAVTAPATGGGTVAHIGNVLTNLPIVTQADMPPGYICDKGMVFKEVITPSKGRGGGPPTIEYKVLFKQPIYHPWAEMKNLHFTVHTDKVGFRQVTIPFEEITSNKIEACLAKELVKTETANLQWMRGFLMDFMTLLHKRAEAEKSAPFGWLREGDKVLGFSYAGVLFKTDGTIGPTGRIDARLAGMYTPSGKEQVWHDAYKLVYDQNRPGLEAIVAMHFGAPLMQFSGEYGGVMSVFGEGGAGKTTAMEIGLAIWGSPVQCKERESATPKSVIERLGAIQNLPFSWDEVKDDVQEKAYKCVYQVSTGGTGSRLNADISFQERKLWYTICGIFSNPSFSNYVLKKNGATTAGVNRIFEWKEELPPATGPGLISTGDAGRMLRDLDNNFGQVGKKWAQWLATNHEAAKQNVVEWSHWFEAAVKDPTINTNPERFWLAMCSAVMSGAFLANAVLDIPFHLEELRDFLLAKYLEQRQRVFEENVQGGSADWTESLLTRFLQAHTRNTIRTQTAPSGPGVPGKIDTLQATYVQGNPVYVQWVLDGNRLRFSRAAVDAWAKSVEADGVLLRQGLKKHFGAICTRFTLAAGTQYAGGPDYNWTIQLQDGSPLHNVMEMTGGDGA